MIKPMSAVLLLLVSTSLLAQEPKHAPTVDQCRADYGLWAAPGSDMDFKDVAWKELVLRSAEMTECADVDSEWMHAFLDQEIHKGWRNASVNYMEAGSWFAAAASKRELHFITRHQLMNQLLDEDAAGKR